MSDGVDSVSGSSFSAQIQPAQQQVKVLQKEQEGAAQLKLLDSAPTSSPRPDPSSPVGYNVNVKA